MGQISQFLRSGEGRIAHFCPACQTLHAIYVDSQDPQTGNQWDWDHNIVSPTLSPSVSLKSEHKGQKHHCHYTITAGEISYCGDCTHFLKGVKIRLPPLPSHYRDQCFVP